MTHYNEINQEAAMPTDLLHTKSENIFGTWYARTMFQSGKAAHIAREMQNYKIKVLGLSQTRLISAGKTTLATGDVVLYSGHQEEDGPILIGYFNANIGNNNTGYEEIMGKHGIGQINENGERFVPTTDMS